GLAAALALGADGVLLGTRFLATPEAPVPSGYKQAIIDSDGHDTILTEIPDIGSGRVWPGAMSRVRRNRFIERWAGREWELRQFRNEVGPQLATARQRDDVEEYALQAGQTCGLINEIKPAGEIVREIVEQAEAIIGRRLPGSALGLLLALITGRSQGRPSAPGDLAWSALGFLLAWRTRFPEARKPLVMTARARRLVAGEALLALGLAALSCLAPRRGRGDA